MFELVVLLLLGHMWGSREVHHLWARPCRTLLERGSGISVLMAWQVDDDDVQHLDRTLRATTTQSQNGPGSNVVVPDTWLWHYEPKPNKLPCERKYTDLPVQIIYMAQWSVKNVALAVFWNMKGSITVYFALKIANVNKTSSCQFLVKFTWFIEWLSFHQLTQYKYFAQGYMVSSFLWNWCYIGIPDTI